MGQRRPSDRAAAWAFWRDVLAGHFRAVTWEPQCGFYRVKQAGRSLAVSIDLHQEIDPETGELIADERLVCTVDGRERDAGDVWERCAGQPITEEEFHRLRRAPVATDLTRQVVV